MQFDFALSEWWWPDGLVPAPNQYADFACDLVLDDPCQTAAIALSCGSYYTLWINGVWLSHGPPREVAPWCYYDTLDLRGVVRLGLNRFRIRAHHLGVSHQSHEACMAGVLVCGVIQDRDTQWNLGDRTLWHAGPTRGHVPHARRLNSCTGFAEHWDLSLDDGGWLMAPAEDCGRSPVVVAKHPLENRPHWMPSDVVLQVTGVKQAQPIGAKGGWQVWDFSEEVFGFVGLEVEAGVAGSCEIIHGESLAEDELPDWRFGGGDFREILELPQGRRAWESFEKRALRYLALPAQVRVHALTVREYGQPLEPVWESAPEASLLTAQDRAIVRAAARTVQLCSDDLLNDCPRRERAQYNDPALYAEAFPILFGSWEPYRRWLRQFSRGANAAGVLRACYPGPSSNRLTIPDFSILFASNLRRYLDASGDRQTVGDCYESALVGVEAYETWTGSDGLLADVPGWVFLCNSFELARRPRSSALNALWASSWDHLAVLGELVGDSHSGDYRDRAMQLRRAWRNAFLKEGRVFDADSSPDHESRQWWNFHYEAERGHYKSVQNPAATFTVRFRWSERVRRLWIASPGSVRLWWNGRLILQETPRNPWVDTPVFHPWSCELSDGEEGELVLEVGYSSVDWEVYVAAEAGYPVDTVVEGEAPVSEPLQMIPGARAGRPVKFRPWSAPRHNQISVGYAAACGMLEESEAHLLLRSCLRENYHVPWLKRTTPIIATPTEEVELIRERAVLCNTPHSLFFYCQALAQYGLREEARELCRRLFGAILESGSSTLWEEFAPRSSLCHAWGAMCVSVLWPCVVSPKVNP